MALATQSSSNTSVAITVNTSFASAPQQDNLLIAVVTASVGVGSISLSNAGWSTGTSIAVGVAGGMVVFYKIAAAGGGDQTVTANATLATFMDIQIFEYEQITNESPLDKIASTADTGSGVTSRASGTTATLSQGNELAFVAYAQAGANGGGASLTNSFNVELTTTHLITGDISVTATTALSSTASWTTSQRAAGVILTFFGEVGDSFGTRLPLKPRIPIINGNHPLAKGLIFDTPFFERGGTTAQDITTKLKGTIVASGATWDTNLYGPDLDFSAAASSVNYTTLATQSSLSKISIEVLMMLRGAGASTLSRIIHKGDASSYDWLFFYNTQGTPAITFSIGNATTDTEADYTFTADSLWHHWIVTCSNLTSLNPNVINLYKDGGLLAQSVSTTGIGANDGDTTSMNIGNRPDGTRGINAKIAYVRFWNRVLNAQEAKQLASNPWQIYKQPGLLGVGS